MIDNKLAPYGAFVLRVALGVMFLAHAYLKFGVFGIAGFQGFLAQTGFPTALAWPVILGEAANTATTYGYDSVTMMQETKTTVCQIVRAV